MVELLIYIPGIGFYNRGQFLWEYFSRRPIDKEPYGETHRLRIDQRLLVIEL